MCTCEVKVLWVYCALMLSGGREVQFSAAQHRYAGGLAEPEEGSFFLHVLQQRLSERWRAQSHAGKTIANLF